MTTRRISIFTQPDGEIVYDRPWDPEISPTTTQPNPSGETLWPLIKVFLQFSTAVQGGSVRRLVFRSPSEYTPEPQIFRPALAQKSQRDPMVAHIAHDELFVVVVTERSEKRTLLPDDDDPTEGIAKLCGTLKEFLNAQQDAYLANLSRYGVFRESRSYSARTEEEASVEEEASGTAEVASEDGDGSENVSNDALRPSPQNTSIGDAERLVVTISHAEVDDFIAKAQTTLQL